MIELPPLRRLLFLAVILGLAVGFAVGPLAWDALAGLVAAVVAVDFVRALRRGVLGVDVIALLAIAVAVVLSQHLAAIIIALMIAGVAALEEFAEARARRELAALIGRTPRTAHRRGAEGFEDVPIGAVRPDDILLVKPGEIVPVDGIITTESVTLDESALTGEPIPVTHASGDLVTSGVVNAGGPFDLQATATAERSTYVRSCVS